MVKKKLLMLSMVLAAVITIDAFALQGTPERTRVAPTVEQLDNARKGEHIEARERHSRRERRRRKKEANGTGRAAVSGACVAKVAKQLFR